MYIAYTREGKALVAGIGAGFTPESAAAAMGLAPGTWREITDEEAAELQKPTLEQTREAALETLKQTRLAHEYAGPLVPVDGVPVRFPSEVKDETRLNSLALMFAQSPDLVVPDWKVADDVYVTMTAPLLAQVMAAGSAHIAFCFSVERMKREEIKALPSAEAVSAWLDTELETGWPE